MSAARIATVEVLFIASAGGLQAIRAQATEIRLQVTIERSNHP